MGWSGVKCSSCRQKARATGVRGRSGSGTRIDSTSCSFRTRAKLLPKIRRGKHWHNLTHRIIVMDFLCSSKHVNSINGHLVSNTGPVYSSRKTSRPRWTVLQFNPSEVRSLQGKGWVEV